MVNEGNVLCFTELIRIIHMPHMHFCCLMDVELLLSIYHRQCVLQSYPYQ